ncbi:LCP family protein [Saccharibacillus alkalitolerans]|uniref:LCP family protein n=1 Tax=Saccharibacillus alkalitolerans TaxID=2705290 RepID=A0ABX0F1X3_9BACL|nr:LCP family protein [Saccharibacillus alkalitolerans]NGZ73860.1 LCP family protein [Saccharibacillus alkalitolerans]
MSSTRGGGLPPRAGGGRGRSAETPSARRSAGASGGGGGNGRRPAGKKKKSGAKRFWTFFLVLLLLLVVGAGVYLGWMYQKSQSIGTGGEPAKPASTQPIAMVLLGTDFREETDSHLTDVVMVAAMNPKTDTATVVSLPRDTRIELEGYKVRKVNAYYPAFLAQEKKGEGEAKAAMQRMLSKYFDIPIDYVTVVNFQSLRDIVDALGGIEVDVMMDMCYKDTADGTDINLKKGPQKLDGKNALDYVRYRKTNCNPPTGPSDDFSRNQRQQQVIGAIMDKVQTFNALTKSGSLIDAVADNTDTDLENKQILNLVKTYWDIPKENISYPKVTGQWRSPFVYINDGELSAAKQALKDELAGNHRSSSAESGQ